MPLMEKSGNDSDSAPNTSDMSTTDPEKMAGESTTNASNRDNGKCYCH